MTTLSIAIASGAADVYEDATTGNVTTGGTTLGASLDATTDYVGLMFTSTSLPANAIILSATVDVIPTASTEDEPDILIDGFYGGGLTSWNSAPASFGVSAPATGTATSTVSWSNTNLGANGTTRFSSPSIVSIISAIVSNAGYDNYLPIRFQGSATSTRDLTIKSYESAVSDAATLTIEFVPPNTQRMSMMGCG